MANKCLVTLMGKIGKDGEYKEFKSGNHRATFYVAITRPMKKDDGSTEFVADWYFCTMFGHQAEKHSLTLTKNTKVFVLGDLKLHKFKNKEGNEQVQAQVLVKDLQYLDMPEVATPTKKKEVTTEPLTYQEAQELSEMMNPVPATPSEEEIEPF